MAAARAENSLFETSISYVMAYQELEAARTNLERVQQSGVQQTIMNAEEAVAQAEAKVDDARQARNVASELNTLAQAFAEAANETVEYQKTLLAQAEADVRAKEAAYSASGTAAAAAELQDAKAALMNRTRELWRREWAQAEAEAEYESFGELIFFTTQVGETRHKHKGKTESVAANTIATKGPSTPNRFSHPCS